VLYYFSCLSGIGSDLTKKCIRTRYIELVFFHSVGSAGHVVHSSASGVRNGDALLFMLR
jgi:hypothetical protein